MARYPKGVAFVPHNPKRPFQARIAFQRRRYSLGYFASVEEAEEALAAVRKDIKEWGDMQIPPPSLHQLMQALAR